jgi:SAM-dependent methyltransferase
MANKVLPGPEFDSHASDYESKVQASLPEMLSEGNYFSRYKVKIVLQSQQVNGPKKILDFGCGIGVALQLFLEYFPDASLWGYDVSSVSIEHARHRVPSAVLTSNLDDLVEGYFDVIFVANVLHHIPKDARLTTLRTCRDALNPGGRIYVFEHNPYNPITKRVFDRCPFDQGAEMISLNTMLALADRADLQLIDKRYTLFFPKQLRALRCIEPMLYWLPIGAQYCVELAK